MTSSITPLTREQKKILFLSSLGGVLEYYDFIIYIFLAPYIEKIFFATSESYLATLKTLAIFSIGYLFRPLGGIVFAHFGDKYGRKIVFFLTVVCMALPSFAIGLLPTPEKIGILAPILLLIFRILQGLALGGEIPAAIVFVAEHVGMTRRASSLSVLFFGINLGLMLGSFVISVITSILPESDILTYAWRIPFLIAGVFGIFTLFLRRYLHETVEFSSLKPHEIVRIPFLSLIRTMPISILKGMLLVAIGSVSVFFYLYWPQYLHQYLNYEYKIAMNINTAATFALSMIIILAGLLCDKFGTRKIYLIITFMLAIFTYPLFFLFDMQNIYLVMFAYFIFSILFGFIPSAYSSLLCAMFPTSLRYSGVAICYNLAYALFGGLSPIICTLVIHAFNNVLAPAFYMSFIAMLSFMTCYFFIKK